jgi:hypothetical protein
MECFDHITGSEISETIDTDTALKTSIDFGDIILECA